jgi:hypothetical protein
MSSVEVWRPWRGGEYEASNLGRIRRAVAGVRQPAGHVVKATLKPQGYLSFSTHACLRTQNVYVHAVVAEAFLGSRPDGCDVNHIDGNKTNNCVENLEYVTRKGNMEHASRLGLLPSGDRHVRHLRPELTLRGSASPAAKLREQDVVSIRRRHRAGVMQRHLAAEYGVKASLISMIVSGKRWAHIKEQP